MTNRLALVTVLAMLAMSVVVDGLLPLEMPGSIGQLLGHAPRTVMPRNGSEALVQLAASQQVSTPPYEPSGGFLGEAATNMPVRAGEGGGRVDQVPGRVNASTQGIEVALDGLGNSAERLPVLGVRGGDDRSGLGGLVGGTPGVATYYHPSLAGGVMANGRPYNPWDPAIAASNDYPLGTTLVLEYRRAITVVVSDRGLLGPGHVDLSQAGMVALVGSTAPGRIAVEVTPR